MISIIIPIYNTPVDYLKRCLTSIADQPYKEYELILINDGSQPDLSHQYEILAKQYHARIFRQDNHGVSSARNYGIRLASGDYIAFIDADDVILPDFLPQASTLTQNSGYDIIIGSIQDTEKQYDQSFTTSTVILHADNSMELEYALLGQKGKYFKCNSSSFYLLGSSCGRLYRTSIAKKIHYEEELKYSEDQLFNRLFFKEIKSAVIVPDHWYEYSQNTFSAMHGAYDTYLNQMQLFWNLWNSITEQETDPLLQKASYILALQWFNGFVSDRIIPEQTAYIQKHNAMISIMRMPIFSYAVNHLIAHDLKLPKNKITFFLMKYQIIDLIYMLNWINMSLRILHKL